MAQSVRIADLRPKHHAIIDRLLIEPTIKMEHLAQEIGVSRTWLSIVMRSDVFVEEYTKRRMAQNSHLSRAIVEKQLKVALKALDKIELILDDDEVEDRLVLDTATQTIRSLGFGPSAGSAPKITENEVTERETIRQVAPGVVERARERIRKSRVSEPSDGDVRALPATEG